MDISSSRVVHITVIRVLQLSILGNSMVCVGYVIYTRYRRDLKKV